MEEVIECEGMRQSGCVGSGLPDVDVFHVPDPFAMEIYGDETLFWLCETCQHDSYMET